MFWECNIQKKCFYTCATFRAFSLVSIVSIGSFILPFVHPSYVYCIFVAKSTMDIKITVVLSSPLVLLSAFFTIVLLQTPRNNSCLRLLCMQNFTRGFVAPRIQYQSVCIDETCFSNNTQDKLIFCSRKLSKKFPSFEQFRNVRSQDVCV